MSVKSARLEFTLRAQITAEQRQRLLMEMGARLNAERNQAEVEKRRRQDAEFFASMEATLAPAHKIEQFTIKLDRYETATVQALMDNDRDTVAIRDKIDGMLLKAHALPDGRRVFKTEDGTRVFDEFGAQLKTEEIDPQAIDDAKPKWEAFDAAGIEMDRLAKERTELIDYQSKLDRSRERAKDSKLTEGELSALDKELGETMPDRVRKLTGEQKPDQQRELAADVVPDSAPPSTDPNRAAMAPATFRP
ncbi:hypothetical protein [Bosea caraganae]|uniref:hypothetical protein n=1 Tax=Bosea caraganae TaxID=2763117 RepID=UPI0011C02226|nr:hypothetical protein [Bosea caraganae]